MFIILIVYVFVYLSNKHVCFYFGVILSKVITRRAINMTRKDIPISRKFKNLFRFKSILPRDMLYTEIVLKRFQLQIEYIYSLN